MNCTRDRPSPHPLANKPSSSFSSVSSAASATSAGSARSETSRLLFGEIDTSSERSSGSYASVCSFVLSDSSSVLKFWLEDRCRDTLLSLLPTRDLARLRLVCHDFGVRAAPALFRDLDLSFRANTFTKPSKLAALERLGSHVRTLRFRFPHTPDTFLPPLVDPATGAEVNFTYSPASAQTSKYGDAATTDILTRQYPPLFHAATNVPAFIRAFAAFSNLEHLLVSCPGYDSAAPGFRRSTVDYALISLRIAVERAALPALHSLSLAPIHPAALMYLSPILGLGSSPRSAASWTRIRNLTIHLERSLLPSSPAPDQFQLLQTYLCNFQQGLESFSFRWIRSRGPFPIFSSLPDPLPPPAQQQQQQQQHLLFGEHPAHLPTPPPPSTTTAKRSARPLRFPKLHSLHVAHVSTEPQQISAFLARHSGSRTSLRTLDFEDVLLSGCEDSSSSSSPAAAAAWDEALAPLLSNRRSRDPLHPSSRLFRSRKAVEKAEIPIMLSPSACAAAAAASSFQKQMHGSASQQHQHDQHGKRETSKSLRVSRVSAPAPASTHTTAAPAAPAATAATAATAPATATSPTTAPAPAPPGFSTEHPTCSPPSVLRKRFWSRELRFYKAWKEAAQKPSASEREPNEPRRRMGDG